MNAEARAPRVAWALALIALFAVALVLDRSTADASLAADDSGPEFTTSEEDRAKALVCPRPLTGVSVDPVLLIHGTTVDPERNFSWNWMRALDADGIPWCSVALVDNGMGDIQDSAEHVVHAIRTMATQAGRRIDIVGHSQGGMIGRWATKWWPDTRLMVDDLVGLAPDNHGTDTAEPMCDNGCAPAIHQQQTSAAFIAALNDGPETFAEIDYTAIYTHFDAVVTPNADETGSSSLRSGDGAIANIATQDVCPANTADHLSVGTYDAVGYAIARDALDHGGPASIERIDAAVCAQPYMPGVDPTTVLAEYGEAAAFLASTMASYPHVDEEPPLRCYVTDSCPPKAGLQTDYRMQTAEAPAAEVAGDAVSGVSLPATGGRSDAILLAAALLASGLGLHRLRRVA